MIRLSRLARSALPGLNSEIFFAQTREDALIDMRVARLVSSRLDSDKLRIMAVGSGGCTVLSLLSLPFVSTVVAVDQSKAQLHLIHLKHVVMMLNQSLHAKLDFLGCSPDLPDSPGRREDFYQVHVRPLLSPEHAQFWDARLPYITMGVNRSGRFEELFRQLAQEAGSVGISPVASPLEAVRHPDWKAIFAKVFDRQLLSTTFGPASVDYSMSQEFHDHFSDVFAHALLSFDAKRNYFLSSLWNDAYPTVGDGDPLSHEYLMNQFRAVDTNGDGFIDEGELRQACVDAGSGIDGHRAHALFASLGATDPRGVSVDQFLRLMYRLQDTSSVPELQALLVKHTLPPFLQPQSVSRIRSRGTPAVLQLSEGSVVERCTALAAAEGKFDVVQISNITDWMSIPAAEELLVKVRSCLNPGGAVICRRLNGDYKLENVVGRRFMIDPYLNHGLKAADRSFFYNEVVVGFHEAKVGDGASNSAFSQESSDSNITSQLALSSSLPVRKLDGWLSAAALHSRRSSPVTADQHHLLRPTPSWLSAADLAHLSSFDEVVACVCRLYDFNNHPYIEWMLEPSTTVGQFRATQLPFKFAVERFSQPLAAVAAKLDRTSDRLAVVENLSEEHGLLGGGVAHVLSFAQFLRAMGVTQAEVDACTPPVHMHAFSEALLGHCTIRSPRAGAAALGIIEALYVNISDAISKTILQRKWVLQNTQSHYAVHAELDIKHAKDLLDIARPAWYSDATAKAEICGSVLFAAHQFWTLYSGMVLHGEDTKKDITPK